MKNKKIRVLLGGYVNNINAQDLNCRALAMFLDKDKFDVSAFLVPQEFKDFDIGEEMAGVKLIQLNRPAKILWYWIYFKGILNCDIAYLPKGQKRHWCRFLCKLLGKKSFTTVEGLMTGDFYNSYMQIYGGEEGIRRRFNEYDRTYSITQYMSVVNDRILGIKSDGVLYLGVDTQMFNHIKTVNKTKLTDIIFIGTDIKRKRIQEFLKLAQIFPNINFHIVGGYPEFADELSNMGLHNVNFHGRLTHEGLSELLPNMDLHVFPSRSEGFPKVTLETAAAGVPSILYGDYGASEWITSGHDGYIVDTFDEIIDILRDLQSNPNKLTSLSANTISMSKRFDWRKVVTSWEKMLEEWYKS